MFDLLKLNLIEVSAVVVVFVEVVVDGVVRGIVKL
jgi:hypothetical protein